MVAVQHGYADQYFLTKRASCDSIVDLCRCRGMPDGGGKTREGRRSGLFGPSLRAKVQFFGIRITLLQPGDVGQLDLDDEHVPIRRPFAFPHDLQSRCETSCANTMPIIPRSARCQDVAASRSRPASKSSRQLRCPF